MGGAGPEDLEGRLKLEAGRLSQNLQAGQLKLMSLCRRPDDKVPEQLGYPPTT